MPSGFRWHGNRLHGAKILDQGRARIDITVGKLKGYKHIAPRHEKIAKLLIHHRLDRWNPDEKICTHCRQRSIGIFNFVAGSTIAAGAGAIDRSADRRDLTAGSSGSSAMV